MSTRTPAPASAGPAPPTRLDDQELYINRELSWLDFNERVLIHAEDTGTPLLERAKFAAIFSSNLDEFFMVRVAGLHDQIAAEVETAGIAGHTPAQTLALVRECVRELAVRQSACVEQRLLPALAEHGIAVKRVGDATERERAELTRHFERVIFPALTPLAVGPGQPFPYISNLSLSIGVIVRDPQSGHEAFARVKVPLEVLPRFVQLEQETTFFLLEDVIAANLGALFSGMEIADYGFFRVTRDADLDLADDAEDLLRAVEDQLRRRRFGEVVRVEVGDGMAAPLLEQLTEALGVDEHDVFSIPGMLDLTGLWQLARQPGFSDLRDAPFIPASHPSFRSEGDEPADVFRAMREGDLLVHHPYDSFASSVERFVEQAVEDPNVVAIKQTVYRTSDESQLVPALIRAAERGKQAVCVVELKARFDEQTNIQWAKSLEEAGVHVVYGHPSLKTHAKCVLVVRREGDGVRNYVHIGTGNYNSETARLYTDFGLLTTDEQIGADIAELFNYLTGFARPAHYRKVLVAPTHLRNEILREIDETIAAHRPDAPARIAIKVNALTERSCIEALYRASIAGVRVALNVRGICCLRPGVPGVSENISVVSVVGRYLEHSRVYAFRRNERDTVYISSADLMSRNLDTRIELAVPLSDDHARAGVLDVLERCLADERNAWELSAGGQWRRRRVEGATPRDAQRELIELHAAR